LVGTGLAVYGACAFLFRAMEPAKLLQALRRK